jgi:hypothetical protein
MTNAGKRGIASLHCVALAFTADNKDPGSLLNRDFCNLLLR